MMQRLADWLDKQLVPILQRRALKRLEAAIDSYHYCLQGRAKSGAKIEEALDGARAALKNGKIDQGWKCFQAAQRIELFALNGTELKAVATAMRKEADKLNVWRKIAVLDLLTVKESESQDLAVRIFRAALLRDEHYSNEAYKNGLRSSNALRLAVVLVIVLLTLFLLARAGHLLGTTDGTNSFKELLSMGMVGLLGATISAITDAPTPQSTMRIPELVSSIRVTALRLLMGPASAIVIYFVTQSDLYSAIFKTRPEDYALLVIAFVAGFTERLVLRVVEMIAKPTA
jgi:hypothetical protein